MPFILDTTTVTTGSRANMGNTPNDYTLVLEGVTAGSMNNNAVVGTGQAQTVTVAGNLWSAFLSGIVLQGEQAMATILPGGSVTNVQTQARPAVWFTASEPHLSNLGDIAGASGVQLLNVTDNALIQNAGNIVATGRGFSSTDVAAGVSVRSTAGVNWAK